MPIDIHFFSEFTLRTLSNKDTEVVLPSIQLVPISGSQPYIYSLNITVRGQPTELAARIQQVYRQIVFQYETPILFKNPWVSQVNSCHVDQPLNQFHPQVDCTLQVSIEYCESDHQGQPNFSVRNNIAKTCVLSWFPTPNYPDKDMKDFETPTDSESEVDTKIQPPENYSNSNSPSHHQPNSMNNPTSEKNEYTGLLSIDFGTSNSTVTVFDPKSFPSLDGLPQEQEQRLREKLYQWLNSPVTDALPSINTHEWKKFISEISKIWQIDPSDLIINLANENRSYLLETLRQMELCLPTYSEVFRRAMTKKLSELYTETFQIPPLISHSFFTIILDIVRKQKEICSELEIVSWNESPEVLMGERAKQNRRAAIAQIKGNTDHDNWQEIAGRFHHSPKRYLGLEQSFSVMFDNERQTISFNELIQAIYCHLIKLTEEYRQSQINKFGEHPVKTAIVTYPTVASPLIRRDLETIIKNLNLSDVETVYDEAVAVALFYLWREFSGNLNFGIESFKTRCHYDGFKWYQNLLVIDIGGGTTDIALIELTLEEIDPFEPHEDRGAGGRYYVLTPKILGSSGHLQLGGELITLRLVRLLKVAIADLLLQAQQEGSLESRKLQNYIYGLDERFLDGDQFRCGSFLECIDKKNPEGEQSYRDTLNAAEIVLPTQWKYYPERLQMFYTLWDLAEEIKLKLGKPFENSEFTLDEQKISEFIREIDIDAKIINRDNLTLTINQKQFDRIVTPVIQEAISIAKELFENRLSPVDVDIHNPNSHKIDWLILSGQTCNLPQVQEEIYQTFSQSQYFVWNPERVTFVAEFAKIATSIGACWAETIRRYGFTASNSKKDLLPKGANQLDIEIKNLFYFLPCSFILRTIPDHITLFEAGKKLTQLDDEETVKARTKWMGMQLATSVYRIDYDKGERRNWGNFNGKVLADSLGIDRGQFRKYIQAQFEINQKLQIKLFLCQGNPHYFISQNLPALNGNLIIEILHQEGFLWKKAVKDTKRPPQDGDIAVNVIEAYKVDAYDAYHLIFEIVPDVDQSFNTFHYEGDNQPRKGLISEKLPPFSKIGKHTFFLFQKGEWKIVGELSQPKNQTEFPCEYCVTFDDKGTLRIHAGEVLYYMSNNPECLKEKGYVLSTELELLPNEMSQERDPFCGEH